MVGLVQTSNAECCSGEQEEVVKAKSKSIALNCAHTRQSESIIEHVIIKYDIYNSIIQYSLIQDNIIQSECKDIWFVPLSNGKQGHALFRRRSATPCTVPFLLDMMPLATKAPISMAQAHDP